MTNSKYIRFKTLTHGRKLFWIPVIFATAAVFSFFVFITPAEGGYATFMSMAIIGLVGYIYGPPAGFATSFFFGILMFFLYSQVPTVDVIEKYLFRFAGEERYWGEVADYIIGYTLMGATGFFCPTWGKKAVAQGAAAFSAKYRYVKAFAFAAFLRFVEGVWNCWQFYSINPENGSVLGYCLWYSFWYIGVEALLSIAVLLIPAVANAVQYISECAVEKYKDNRNFL
ncbi:MAG: hypothetical protein J5493_08230 [Lachnospiraceae bacterium]|nr:hypothetical protein [Lachnospiraceae bacterium]